MSPPGPKCHLEPDDDEAQEPGSPLAATAASGRRRDGCGPSSPGARDPKTHRGVRRRPARTEPAAPGLEGPIRIGSRHRTARPPPRRGPRGPARPADQRRAAGPARRDHQSRVLRRRRGGRADAPGGEGEDRPSPEKVPDGRGPRPGRARSRDRAEADKTEREDRPEGHGSGLRRCHGLQQPEQLRGGRGRQPGSLPVHGLGPRPRRDPLCGRPPALGRPRQDPADPQFPEGLTGAGPPHRLRGDHDGDRPVHELRDQARRPHRRPARSQDLAAASLVASRTAVGDRFRDAPRSPPTLLQPEIG